MKLVYIDEAGISKPSQEPFLTVAGVIVDADRKLIQVERHLAALVSRYIPEHQRDGFVFHATEIFNGGGKVFHRAKAGETEPEWPLKRRLALAADLAAIPMKFKLPLSLAYVERATAGANVPHWDAKGPRERGIVEHALGFMTCAMQVEHWMRQNASAEVCMLIAEDAPVSRSFITESVNYHQRSDITALLDDDGKRHFPFRKIKQSPLFEPKRGASILQLADFCAYVFKRIVMNEDDARYWPFYDAMRSAVVVLDPTSLVQISGGRGRPLHHGRLRNHR